MGLHNTIFYKFKKNQEELRLWLWLDLIKLSIMKL